MEFRLEKAYQILGKTTKEWELTPETIWTIRGVAVQVDPRQVEIRRRMTPSQRPQQEMSIACLAHSKVRYQSEMGVR